MSSKATLSCHATLCRSCPFERRHRTELLTCTWQIIALFGNDTAPGRYNLVLTLLAFLTSHVVMYIYEAFLRSIIKVQHSALGAAHAVDGVKQPRLCGTLGRLGGTRCWYRSARTCLAYTQMTSLAPPAAQTNYLLLLHHFCFFFFYILAFAKPNNFVIKARALLPVAEQSACSTLLLTCCCSAMHQVVHVLYARKRD